MFKFVQLHQNQDHNQDHSQKRHVQEVSDFMNMTFQEERLHTARDHLQE